jgi:hypothetical protein
MSEHEEVLVVDPAAVPRRVSRFPAVPGRAASGLDRSQTGVWARRPENRPKNTLPLQSDQMKEILTLQFGPYSNYIGSHFWNFQVCLRVDRTLLSRPASRAPLPPPPAG